MGFLNTIFGDDLPHIMWDGYMYTCNSLIVTYRDIDIQWYIMISGKVGMPRTNENIIGLIVDSQLNPSDHFCVMRLVHPRKTLIESLVCVVGNHLLYLKSMSE